MSEGESRENEGSERGAAGGFRGAGSRLQLGLALHGEIAHLGLLMGPRESGTLLFVLGCSARAPTQRGRSPDQTQKQVPSLAGKPRNAERGKEERRYDSKSVEA